MPDQNASPAPASDRIATIARLNDALRQNLTQPGHNRVVMTIGVQELIGDVSLFRNFHAQAELLRTIRDYDDRTLDFGSPDPADSQVTTRVLTILLTNEY